MYNLQTPPNQFINEFYREDDHSQLSKTFNELINLSEIHFSEEEIQHFVDLYKIQYFQLFDIVRSYMRNKDYPVVKEYMKELLNVDIDGISIHSEKKTQTKMRRYYSFQKLMRRFQD